MEPEFVDHTLMIKLNYRRDVVTEGQYTHFRIDVRGLPKPHEPFPRAGEPFPLNLKVEDSGDVVPDEFEGHQMVQFKYGDHNVDFRVPTVNDNQDEPHGRVTVSLADANGNVPTTSQAVRPGANDDPTARHSAPVGGGHGEPRWAWPGIATQHGPARVGPPVEGITPAPDPAGPAGKVRQNRREKPSAGGAVERIIFITVRMENDAAGEHCILAAEG